MQRMAITTWGEALETVDWQVPEPAGTEVLVRVECCGVCHSDVHVWDGYFDLGGGKRLDFGERMTLPFAPGHEIVGTVAALGPEATGVSPGDSLVVYPWIGCGACPACLAGNDPLCANHRSLGVRRDGGFADHVMVPHPRYLVPYGELPAELACTYACSGITSYSALRRAGPLAADDWLLVIGAGGVGASAIRMVKPVVGARLVVADIDPAKRQAALAAGADVVVDNRADDALSEVRDMTGGGAAAAVDFVGAPQTMRFGIDAIRRGGKLVMVGLFGGSIELPTFTFPGKIITVEGSFVGTLQDLKDVIALARSGELAPIPVATRPVAEASAVLGDLKAGGRILGRVVLTHPSEG